MPKKIAKEFSSSGRQNVNGWDKLWLDDVRYTQGVRHLCKSCMLAQKSLEIMREINGNQKSSFTLEITNSHKNLLNTFEILNKSKIHGNS